MKKSNIMQRNYSPLQGTKKLPLRKRRDMIDCFLLPTSTYVLLVVTLHKQLLEDSFAK